MKYFDIFSRLISSQYLTVIFSHWTKKLLSFQKVRTHNFLFISITFSSVFDIIMGRLKLDPVLTLCSRVNPPPGSLGKRFPLWSFYRQKQHS